MPNVLVFESDGAFAGELKGELERRGCSVTVVDDASVGLQTAASDRPDLILLTIELPRMNGFSVCNKLKRDPALKEVPLIIMSSDSTEETFEQHRRLRTHAEDYVHKPITFVELLPRITAHVPIGNGAPIEEDVVLDAEVDFDDAEVVNGSVPPSPDMAIGGEAPAAASQPADAVDDEVDAFTENAFGSLMDEAPQPPAVEAAPLLAPDEGQGLEDDPVAAALQSVPSSPMALPFMDGGGSLPPASMDLDVVSLPPGPALPSAVAVLEDARPARPVSSIPPRPRIEPVDTALREELARQAERARDLERELREAKSRIAELEDETARAATKNSEVQRLQRELDEAKAKSASGSKGGGSAREFLDLREALNRKDKELLDLRDQITHKEKELLGLRDANLDVEREKADLVDKIEGFEKQANDAARLLEVARADKEQASKRADDFKRKIEKLQGELDAKTAEFDDVKRRADEDRAAFEANDASLRTELEEASATAAAEKLAAVEEARRVALDEGEKAKADAVAQVERGRAEAVAEAERARDQAIEAARQEKEQAVSEARLDKERAVQDLTESAARDREQAIRARELELRREQDAKLAALHRANEDALNRMRAEHAQAVADEKKAGEAALADQESRYAREHEAVVKEHEKAHQVTRDELVEVQALLEDVRRQKTESETERDARIAGLTSDLAQRAAELEDSKRALEERSAELDAARAMLAATRQELAEAQSSLSTEQAKAARASTKWTDDRGSLERAKDALAAALAQLDEIEGRSLD